MREYDESDAKARPPRRGSRPRSKLRPLHQDAVRGVVTAVDRGRLTVMLETGPVTAVKARELGRRALVVGDYASLVGDTSGEPGTLARIVRREERRTVLRRSADDDDPKEKVIVANADQLAIVVALADPEPRPGMIDRCLIAAYDAKLTPLLVLTKADLEPADDLRALYEPLGVDVLDTVVTEGRADGVDELAARLRDTITVLVGHSGVGKSTLVNRLVPSAQRATGAVNVVTGRGRHTSTSAVALPLPDGGWIVDTPGVRSFGLAHVHADAVLVPFPEMAAAAALGCPRGCRHLSAEDGCGLDDWATDPHRRARLESVRRLLNAKASTETY